MVLVSNSVEAKVGPAIEAVDVPIVDEIVIKRLGAHELQQDIGAPVAEAVQRQINLISARYSRALALAKRCSDNA
jgi:hypothetical protein